MTNDNNTIIIPLLEYHQILFQYLSEQNKEIDILKRRDRIRKALLTEQIETYMFDIFHGKRYDFIPALQDKIEQRMKQRIEKKSIYYWFHLYRRIGVEKSFHGESDATLLYYRKILETAFKKYGKKNSGNELIEFTEKATEEERGMIASGHYRKAMDTYGFDYQESEFKGTFLGEFGFKDYAEIYILEGLAFEYWYTTSCFRRLNKGGFLTFGGRAPYSVAATETKEWLMKSFDRRSDMYDEMIASNGIVMSTDNRSNGSCLVPGYNLKRKTLEETGLYEVLYENKTQEYQNMMWGMKTFIPNFVYGLIDLRHYYDVHEHLKDKFQEEYQYGLESFLYTIYLLLKDNALAARKDIQASSGFLRRAYSIWDTKQQLIERLMGLYNAISDKSEYKITNQDIEIVIDDLTLPEERNKIWLSSMGPQYPVFECDDKVIVDYVAIYEVLRTKLHFRGETDDFKGHYFEAVVKSRLKNEGFTLWKCQEQLKHQDGTSKEIDISFIVGESLFIGELKSHMRSLAYINGEKKSLDFRQSLFENALKEADQKALWLRKHRSGANYSIPSTVTRIIPFVVSSFVEYIWSKDENLWLTDEIPRICSAKECELLNSKDVAGAIGNKSYVVKLD